MDRFLSVLESVQSKMNSPSQKQCAGSYFQLAWIINVHFFIEIDQCLHKFKCHLFLYSSVLGGQLAACLIQSHCFVLIWSAHEKIEQPMVSRDKVAQTKATVKRLFSFIVSGLCGRWQWFMHQRHIWTLFGSWLMMEFGLLWCLKVWWYGCGKAKPDCICFVNVRVQINNPSGLSSPVQFSPSLICI